MRYGFLSDKCVVTENVEKGGKAVVACEQIQKGEMISLWTGYLVDFEQLNELSEDERSHTVQISDGFYLAPFRMDEPADFINHSCDPNCGVNGQVMLVAMREIAKGEEISFDYAMVDSSPFDEFSCNCGSALCRGKVTMNDWKIEGLQKKYAGYFSSYLENRIKNQ